MANKAMAKDLDDLVPTAEATAALAGEVSADCNTILEKTIGTGLPKRFVRILTPLLYEEVVRSLFYLGEVPLESRQTLDEATVLDRKSQKAIHLNLARLRLVQKLFLQQVGKELELYNVVHAHLHGGTYLPLINTLAAVLTFDPFFSGLLGREYILAETIAHEVWALHQNRWVATWVDGYGIPHEIDKTRLGKFKRLFVSTWHNRITVASPENVDVKLLPTAVLFYAEPGIGALGEMNRK